MTCTHDLCTKKEKQTKETGQSDKTSFPSNYLPLMKSSTIIKGEGESKASLIYHFTSLQNRKKNERGKPTWDGKEPHLQNREKNERGKTTCDGKELHGLTTSMLSKAQVQGCQWIHLPSYCLYIHQGADQAHNSLQIHWLLQEIRVPWMPFTAPM